MICKLYYRVCSSESPTFVKKLEPAEVVKSSDVTLECEVAGTSPFEILWYKDNKQLRRSKKYKMISDISLVSLCILTSDTSDVGEYKCIVKNDVGSCSCSSTVSLKGQSCPYSSFMDMHVIYFINNYILSNTDFFHSWFKYNKIFFSN